MRRSIIRKKANSLVFGDVQTEIRDLEEQQRTVRPQTSCKRGELKENTFAQGDNSNVPYRIHRKSQLLSLETLGNLIEDFFPTQKTGQRCAKTCKRVICSSFFLADTSTAKKSKDLNFFIKGRPLTAHAAYPEPRKPCKSSTKKRKSVFSYCGSDLATPIDSKFYDEEYTQIEEYTKLTMNPLSRNSVGVLANTADVQEKSVIVEDDLNFNFSQALVSEPKTSVRKKVGVLVATSYVPSSKTMSCKRKGKVLRGPCNRPMVMKKSKLVHNIKIS